MSGSEGRLALRARSVCKRAKIDLRSGRPHIKRTNTKVIKRSRNLTRVCITAIEPQRNARPASPCWAPCSSRDYIPNPGSHRSHRPYEFRPAIKGVLYSWADADCRTIIMHDIASKVPLVRTYGARKGLRSTGCDSVPRPRPSKTNKLCISLCTSRAPLFPNRP